MICPHCGKNTEELPLETPCIGQQVIDHLNKATGKHYRLTPSIKTLIMARVKEGATLEQFKFVNENKAAQWLKTEWEQYLRPDTLYKASRFQGYCNEPDKRSKTAESLLKGEARMKLISNIRLDKKFWR